MKHRGLKISIACLLLLCGLCAWYAADYYHAEGGAAQAMMPGGGITVETAGHTTAFVPENAAAGFIFYPGGKVEHTAYAPLMRSLAENGVLCVLVEMPLNLAVLDMNAAEGIAEQYGNVERWYIGGHSLGGSMAASHAAKHAADYRGLVLLASYSMADLTASGLPVLSVYGSEDGVLNMEKYEKYRHNLPEALAEHIIQGGCHAGFGCYGPQDGDGTPAITTEEQTAQTAALLTEFFNAWEK